MHTLRVGGVTEHFNLPWNLACEQNVFTKAGVEVVWEFFPGGTGAMTAALKNGELDVAILLTEGYIAAVANGLDALIIKEYITSPLGWGIFTASSNAINSIYDPRPKKYAISKKGSGSHLMALIHAEQRGETVADDDLIEVRSLDGALQALTEHRADVFYWEKYTTKPYVNDKQLKLIGEFSAPWSSFLMVASKSCYQIKNNALQQLNATVNEQAKLFISSSDSVSLLMQRFNMSENDAETWLKSTVWNTTNTIRKSSLLNAANALYHAGIIASVPDINALCAKEVILI